MASQPLRSFSPLTSHASSCKTLPVFSKPSLVIGDHHRRHEVGRLVVFPRSNAICSALQESSTATTVSDKKDAAAETKTAAKPDAKPGAAEKMPKKEPVKKLPEMMEEDVIPSLKSTLEAQEDVSQVELSFQDNKLEGAFLKKDIPYFFWAFFPDGVLTGPKGFSLSSYGSGVSTVEPFLIDEKKITPRHVVFWVKKRLAAQGILPVWAEEEGAE